jgi:hypothetical protein
VRYIESNEQCFTPTEIADMFEKESGAVLHPTNVGNAAKKCDLDFIEVEVEPLPGHEWPRRQKMYGEKDLPRIFKYLYALQKKRDAYI